MQNDKIERIRRAALKIFSEQGYAEARMADIAAGAGVSPGTVYRYYKSKKELFDSLNVPELALLKPGFQKKRQEILKAALALFGQAGYSGTTMDDIASRMGFSKAALYQYFKNKEELFTALIQESGMMSLVTGISVQGPAEDFTSTMEKIGSGFMEMYRERGRLDLLRTVICESPRFPEAGRLLYEQAINRGAGRVAGYLGEMKETGELREINPKLAARAFLGMLLSFVLVDSLINAGEREFSEKEIVKGAVEIFLNGAKRCRKTGKEQQKAGVKEEKEERGKYIPANGPAGLKSTEQKWGEEVDG